MIAMRHNQKDQSRHDTRICSFMLLPVHDMEGYSIALPLSHNFKVDLHTQFRAMLAQIKFLSPLP